MKVTEVIHKHIKRVGLGEPILASSLRGMASDANIRQILCRMVKAGELERVSRGIFARPKKNPYLGKVLPGSNEIVKAIAKSSGEIIAPHGAEAVRILHLSTQVPVKPIFYTTGCTRRIKIGKSEIVLKHISPRKLVKPGTIVGLIISALWYLGKTNTNDEIIERIKQQVGPEHFGELFRYTAYMPAWMVNALCHYKLSRHYVR
jgi:hypothetical protein